VEHAQERPSLSKIVVFTSLTLAGVMQAPGRPDKERRGGFEHGGWATTCADAASSRLPRLERADQAPAFGCWPALAAARLASSTSRAFAL